MKIDTPVTQPPAQMTVRTNLQAGAQPGADFCAKLDDLRSRFASYQRTAWNFSTKNNLGLFD